MNATVAWRENDPEVDYLPPSAHYVTIVLATWLLLGLFVDGWAHQNRPLDETFFTPWHAVFYSGFTATAAWMAHLRLRNLRRDVPLDRRGAPPGYGAGMLGLIVFAIGGVGDAIWHTVFGVEVSLEALLSPTHLVSLTGMGLILLVPFRAAIACRTAGVPTAKGPALTSVTLCTLLIGFFTQYLNPFLTSSATSAPFDAIAKAVSDQELAETLVFRTQVHGMASVAFTAVLLSTASAILIGSDLRPRFGLTLLFGTFAVFTAAQESFERPATLMAAILGGFVGDLIAGRPRRLPVWQAAVACGVSAATMSILYFGGVAIAEPLGWPLELWLGTATLSTLLATIAALIVVQPWPAMVPRCPQCAGTTTSRAHDHTHPRPTVTDKAQFRGLTPATRSTR